MHPWWVLGNREHPAQREVSTQRRNGAHRKELYQWEEYWEEAWEANSRGETPASPFLGSTGCSFGLIVITSTRRSDGPRYSHGGDLCDTDSAAVHVARPPAAGRADRRRRSSRDGAVEGDAPGRRPCGGAQRPPVDGQSGGHRALHGEPLVVGRRRQAVLLLRLGLDEPASSAIAYRRHLLAATRPTNTTHGPRPPGRRLRKGPLRPC